MGKSRAVMAIACAVVSMASLASAQDQATERDRRVEVTPYVSMGLGGSNGVGAAVRWPIVGSPFSLEVETNYREGEIKALGSHLSLLYDLPRVGVVTPYLATGIGVEQYGTPAMQGGNIVSREQTAVAVNAGGGVRAQATDNWGYRTDLRWFNPLGRAPERVRIYNGVTFRR
jgi:hypothetical protein